MLNEQHLIMLIHELRVLGLQSFLGSPKDRNELKERIKKATEHHCGAALEEVKVGTKFFLEICEELGY